MNKYKNKKVVMDGIEFDSKKEADRYCELKLLEKAGEICDLQRQVKFVLIPAQYEVVGYTKTGNEKKKLAERECSYIADFTYYNCNTDTLVVEDTKGFKTKDYIIKRKLMLWRWGIRIKEV